MNWRHAPLEEAQSQGTLKRFIDDEGGAVTIVVVVMFAMLMAFIGLLVDVGRIMNIHSQASSYVDRLALTSAAELDGETDAIDRAIKAAVGNATVNPIIGPGFRLTLSGDDAVSVRRLTFLSGIAEDPTDPLTRSPVAGDTVLCSWEAGTDNCDATDSAQALFVLVDATVETEQYIFFPIAAFIAPAMASEASVAPQALAGFTQSICNLPPVVICNPNEIAGAGASFTPKRGEGILLKTKGKGAAWSPGNFGFLDLSALAGGNQCSGGGTNFLRCVLGLVTANTECINGLPANVTTEPGQAVAAHVGLNTRFDIYDAPLKSARNNPNFAPSVNVTKGKVQGKQCTSNKLSDPPPGAKETVPLPRDSCFTTNSCSTNNDSSGRFGNGLTDAQRSAYWSTNHNGASLPGVLSGASRYDMYRYEIDNNLIPNKAPGGENGNPTCSNSSGINNPIRDRRVMVLAIVNCVEHGVNGKKTVPVEELAQVFLTEPSGTDKPSQDDIFVEMLGKVKAGGADGILKEFPVLYR